MQVSRVNQFFARMGRFQVKYRWLILAATLILTIAACLGLPHLSMSSSDDEWFDDHDQIKLNQEHFYDIFGSDDSFMVLVRADDVFAPEVLSAIDRLSRRLENEVPYAERVVSLTRNLSIPKANDEGFEVIDPFEEGIPTDPQELAAKKALVMSRQSLVNGIVSDDSKETWVILSLKKYEGGVEFGKDSIAPFARKVVESEEFKSDRYELLQTGMSYTEMEEEEVITRECAIRIGCGFVVMLFCLILFVRSLRGVVVPAIATVCGIASVLGINAWLGITGDSSMVALPVLLGMALSVGYSIHYINAFRMQFRRSGKCKESVVFAIQETGWPIFFTVITTVASLLSFLFAGIRPIRWIGGISAGIVSMVCLYVMVLIPILIHVTNYGAKLRVEKGDMVVPGDKLTEGAISRKELLTVTDPLTTQEYILKEVQNAYRSQGVEISDKHVEVIAKRMIDKIKVVDGGDTYLLPGSLVNFHEFTDGNKKIIIEGKRPATGVPVLFGITKASLGTDSFLSAASFQETTRILTDAAIRGKTDNLVGLKENVIVGKLIPAGTGIKAYQKVDYDLANQFAEDEPMEALENEFME